MTLSDVVEEIKSKLTGGLLTLEMSDEDIRNAVAMALRELNRYYDETKLITVPYSSCIDLAGSDLDLKDKVSKIEQVYRVKGYGDSSGTSWTADPMYAQQWMIFSNGATMYNLNDYMLNYASWMTLLQIKNTMTTDMDFKEDYTDNRLYLNAAMDKPERVTIEYVPRLTDVEQIRTDYWRDILIRMSLDLTKIALGRIRTRFTQSNAIWAQDGEKLLEEGNSDLKELRETLRTNADYIVGID